MLDELLTDIAAQLKRIADELEAQGRKNLVTNEDFTHSQTGYASRNILLTPDTLISEIDEATPRLVHACARVGIETLGQLAARTERDIYSIKNCGHRTVAEARMILESAGLTFSLDSRQTT